MTPSEPRTDPETTQAYFPDAPDAPPPGPAAFDLLDPPRGPGELGWLAHYRVFKLIGEGGMGLVFGAEDSHLRRPVALKVIRPELADAPAAAERFAREARAAAAIRSDHIVTVYQVGQHRDVAYMAMEQLHGVSLQRWLERGRKPSVDIILRIGREVATGLAAAHAKGLFHRDIKPGNLWLEAPTGRVKILDFGHARSGREEVLVTNAGAINGTPAFMSPEQARGENADASSDLFSLGGVLYRLATGDLPFPGTTILAVLTSLSVDTPRHPSEVDPALPRPVGDLVMSLLAKSPVDRPPSAQAVVDAIRAIERQLVADRQTADLGSIASTPLIDVPPPTKSIGRPWRAAVAAAVVLALLAVIWAGYSAATRTTKPPDVLEPPAAPILIAEAPVEPVPVPVPAPEPAPPPKPVEPGPKAAETLPVPPRPVPEIPKRPEEPSFALGPWGLLIDPDGDCKASVDEEHNRIAIGVPGKPHLLSVEVGQVNAPRILRDVRGDFEARVRVSGTDHPSLRASTVAYPAYHGAGLLLWQGPSNYIRLEVATENRKGKAVRYANFQLRKAGQLTYTDGLALDDRASLLRLERRGGRVIASFGSDGENWTYFPPLEPSFPDRIEIGLTAINSSIKSLQSILEEFRVDPISGPTPVTSAPPPPPVPRIE